MLKLGQEFAQGVDHCTEGCYSLSSPRHEMWEGHNKNILSYQHQEAIDSWQNMRELF